MGRVDGRRMVVCIGAIAVLGGCGTNGVGERAVPLTPLAERSSWTFETTYGGGFNKQGSPIEGHGEVLVDTGADEVCYEQQILGASSAHLHREDGETIVAFFEPPQEFRPNMCVSDVPGDILDEIISSPESFYIEFHNKNSGGTLTSTLDAVDS